MEDSRWLLIISRENPAYDIRDQQRPLVGGLARSRGLTASTGAS
jgi:hypothetical protein